MDKNGRLKLLEYKGEKKPYIITFIDNKPYFVIIKNKNKGLFCKRVNIKTEKIYSYYEGDYKILNDLVII